MATAKTTTKTETPKKETSKKSAEAITPSAKTSKTKAAAISKKPIENRSEGKKKILFVASECTPFIQTGGLAEVIGSLSKALAVTGRYDVRVVVPMYSDIKREYRDKFTYLGNL